MFDDRILGLDSAHVFMVSAQAVAARSLVVAEVGCGRGVLVDLDQPGGAWQDLRGEGRTVIGIDIESIGEENPVIDEFRLIGGGGRWPLEDASVGLAASRAGFGGREVFPSPGPSPATPSWPPRPAWFQTTPPPRRSSACSRAGR